MPEANGHAGVGRGLQPRWWSAPRSAAAEASASPGCCCRGWRMPVRRPGRCWWRSARRQRRRRPRSWSWSWWRASRTRADGHGGRRHPQRPDAHEQRCNPNPRLHLEQASGRLSHPSRGPAGPWSQGSRPPTRLNSAIPPASARSVRQASIASRIARGASDGQFLDGRPLAELGLGLGATDRRRALR